jgi:hypothetical protein
LPQRSRQLIAATQIDEVDIDQGVMSLPHIRHRGEHRAPMGELYSRLVESVAQQPVRHDTLVDGGHQDAAREPGSRAARRSPDSRRSGRFEVASAPAGQFRAPVGDDQRQLGMLERRRVLEGQDVDLGTLPALQSVTLQCGEGGQQRRAAVAEQGQPALLIGIERSVVQDDRARDPTPPQLLYVRRDLLRLDADREQLCGQRDATEAFEPGGQRAQRG